MQSMSAMPKSHATRKSRGQAVEAGARDVEPPAATRPGRRPEEGSLRDRLAAFFQSGQNASDRKLAAMFGASVGSISVYRSQLKKLGIGLPSPPGTRGGGRRRAAESGAADAATRRRAEPAALEPVPGVTTPSLAEIDQVLIQNIETELALIAERHPDLARPVANVQQTIRLLLKLHRR